ncbi:hypothetical protein [Microbulbifer agarilyticus]
MLKFEWYVEPTKLSYGQLLIFYQVYWRLFKPKGYKEQIPHRLIIGEKFLSYFKEGAVAWQIEKSRISYIVLPEKLNPSSAFSNSYEVVVFTNDSDQYVFECTLAMPELLELRSEIEAAANV